MTYKQLRKFYGYTQLQVAQRTGVHRPTVSRFEANRMKHARLSEFYGDLDRDYRRDLRYAFAMAFIVGVIVGVILGYFLAGLFI